MTRWTTEEATRELLHILPLINRLMLAELRPETSDEITMPQFRVMAYLSVEPLTLSVVARMRRVSLQAAGELVQTLVERGWIERSPDPTDRRQSLLNLTQAGRQRYEQTDSRMQERLLPLMKNLTNDEMTAVQTALPALRRILLEANVDAND
jgi:DNA-binding MarR family transcriptional regulator